MIAGFRRFLFLSIVACLGAHGQSAPAAGAPAGAPAAAPNPTSADAVPADPAVPMLKQAYGLITKKDFDGALTLVDEAVKNNPKSFAALTLRGMIYAQKKQWTSAEADFNSALALDPNNIVVKFNLGEMKFQQKDYAAARARFVPLESEKAMSDFANYKVFLCDLFGGNEDQAKKTLDTWDEETGPSFFWGSAAWALVHKNTDDARSWISSALRIFPPSKNEFYAQSLKDLGYLPLPPAPNPSG